MASPDSPIKGFSLPDLEVITAAVKAGATPKAIAAKLHTERMKRAMAHQAAYYATPREKKPPVEAPVRPMRETCQHDPLCATPQAHVSALLKDVGR